MSQRDVAPDATQAAQLTRRESRARGIERFAGKSDGGRTSGVAEPSRADELLTQALKQALVDIWTLDHFVAAGHRVVSFAERGLL